MKILFGAIGVVVVNAIMAPFRLGAAFAAIGAAVGFGCGFLLYGMIEDRQERTRISRELEQDRVKYEQDRHDG